MNGNDESVDTIKNFEWSDGKEYTKRFHPILFFSASHWNDALKNDE